MCQTNIFDKFTCLCCVLHVHVVAGEWKKNYIEIKGQRVPRSIKGTEQARINTTKVWAQMWRLHSLWSYSNSYQQRSSGCSVCQLRAWRMEVQMWQHLLQPMITKPELLCLCIALKFESLDTNWFRFVLKPASFSTLILDEWLLIKTNKYYIICLFYLKVFYCC